MKDGEVKNQQLMDYIIDLKRQYKIGLLSNIVGGGLEVRFSLEEIKTHFDAIAGSGDIGYAKPEAQAYEIIANRLDVRLDECIMIDDQEGYCQGAIGVGMQAIQYVSFEQMKRELEQIISN